MRLRRALTLVPPSAASVTFLATVLSAIAVYLNVADSSAVKTWLVVAIPVMSILAVLVGVLGYAPARRELWYFVIGAQLVGAVAAGVWGAKFAARGEAPVPGGSQDLFFFAFYLVLAAALLGALRRSEPGNQGVVDAGIFAAGGMLLALLAINPYLAGADLDGLGRAVEIASAFAAVSLLAIALRLLMTPDAETPSLQLLVAAAIAWVASDLVWIWLTLTDSYEPGSSVDSGWLVFYALSGAAALHPSMKTLFVTREPRPPVVSWPFLALLALALLGSTAVTGYGLLLNKEAGSAGTVAITSALSLLVLVRIALLLRGEQRLRLELDQRNERLLELDRMKDSFVAAVSHELRTPLTSIRGFTTTMIERWDQLADHEKLSFLQTVESQAKRLSRLVDGVLLVSRIQAGAVANVRQSVDLAATARDAAAELDLAVDIDDGGGTPTVDADPDQIHQIFVNLLVNARRYGMPPIRIDLESDEQDVTVRVSDEGDGVPADFVPYLFDNFTQAPSPRPIQGSGLGLAIVKGMVEAADGDIWYEDNAPRGACFIFKLPHA